MAQFKIYLLNLRANESEFTPKYSIMPISEFDTLYNIHNDDDQNTSKYFSAQLYQDQGFCYTYNEKFKISQNTQRTLSFSMNRNIIRVDRIEKNPFINYLFIGAQLLFVDKYDNHHLMTVSKITYDFKELNTVFNYECSDSFNYQLSRQNDGYEIINEKDDVDFIGARDLDWWVLCKIHPECKISYNYLKLNQPLLVNNKVSSLKPIYTNYSNPDFYKTVPFSGSGTANSVLISLGELYGLQLKIYERFDFNTETLVKYYWFESSKSLRPTGLKYSPYSDLQSFQLSHDGSSFSSVLNIQSNTIGDEIITVIPSVPNFFRQWFESTEWSESVFVPGLFKSACQEKVTILTYDSHVIQSKNYQYDSDNIVINIFNGKLDRQYDYISFTAHSSGKHSTFNITNKEGLSTWFCSKYDNWKIRITYNEFVASSDTITQKQIILYSNLDQIPHKLFQNKNISIDLILPYIADSDYDLVINGDIYFTCFRNPSDEELEFAEIADQLPWLENKLINFNYFQNHSIINKSEYASLMRLLENNLRKINAKLLLYSHLYYHAIQQKTKILASLSSKIDLVGATFQAQFINPLTTNGKITDTAEFEFAMSDLLSTYDEPTKLITYYETLTDYVNKYINAEQAFLKNMYLFREYFETTTNFGTLHEYLFTIPNVEIDKDTIISFSSPNRLLALTENSVSSNYNPFSRITSKTIHYPMFFKQDNTYIPIDKNNIITKENYQNGYYYLNDDVQMIEIKKSNLKTYGHYSKNQIYYEKQWKTTNTELYECILDTPSKQLICNDDENSGNLFLCTISGDKALIQCYQHCLHTINICPSTIVITNHPLNSTTDTKSFSLKDTVTEVYTKVNYAEIRNNYVYKTIRAESGDSPTDLARLYPYITTPIDYISVNTWPTTFLSTYLKADILELLEDAKNWTSEEIDNLSNNSDVIYKKYFPITSYYWKGKKETSDSELYHSVPFVNGENYVNYQRKISVSSKARKNWRIATGVVSVLSGTSAISRTGSILSGLLNLIWRNGDKGFSNDGWTYHDIFNCDYSPSFSGWINSNRLMYVTNEDGYNTTKQREVFDSNHFKGEEWVDVVNGKSAKINIKNWNYNEAKNLLLTYLSLQKRFNSSDMPYYYKTTYWRVLDKDEIIHKQDSFLVIPQPLSGDTPLYFDLQGLINKKGDNKPLSIITLSDPLFSASNSKTIYRLDSTIFYPLKNIMYDINSSDFVWPEDSTITQMTLGELISKTDSKLKLSTDSNCIWNSDIQADGVLRKGNIIFLREETFNYDTLRNNHTWDKNDIYYENLFDYASKQFYRPDTMQEINLIKDVSDFTQGFFVSGVEDEDYVATTNLLTFDPNIEYYQKNNNIFEKRYTIEQLINRGDVYIKPNDSYEYRTFTDINEIYVEYNKYQKIPSTTVKDGFEYKLLGTENGKLTCDDYGIWRLVGTDKKLQITFGKKGSQYVQYYQTELDEMTNGMFWNTYYNSESTILMEKAMLIETNLTEYWTNAYYASKNCKFFIPEYWQPSIDHQKNYFHSDIITPITSESPSDSDNYQRLKNNLVVLPTYVPYVSKTMNQDWYQFKHINIAEQFTDIIATNNNLKLNDSVLVSKIIQDTPAIKSIFEYLNLNANEWLSTKVDEYHISYEYKSGGLLWNEALKSFSNNAISYDIFGGWYDMMINTLQTCNYVDYKPQQYYQAQREHDNLWKTIYTKYPNLIYEKSFTNEDATTSKELLQLAQYAFRDYTQPESNYNISVIDLNTLKGYKGQELKIGDGIEIDANELYNDHDSDIYSSLVQYLFITDISYDLRKDDGIQLTVNPIKYQDKVIGQLIKLIR